MVSSRGLLVLLGHGRASMGVLKVCNAWYPFLRLRGVVLLGGCNTMGVSLHIGKAVHVWRTSVPWTFLWCATWWVRDKADVGVLHCDLQVTEAEVETFFQPWSPQHLQALQPTGEAPAAASRL